MAEARADRHTFILEIFMLSIMLQYTGEHVHIATARLPPTLHPAPPQTTFLFFLPATFLPLSAHAL